MPEPAPIVEPCRQLAHRSAVANFDVLAAQPLANGQIAKFMPRLDHEPHSHAAMRCGAP